MPKLIKNGAPAQDDWTLFTDEATDGDISANNALVPLSRFVAISEAQTANYSKLGVVLKSDDDVAQLAPYAEKLTVVAVTFDVFADGRSFSQARILREQMDFSGEIRAVGNFMVDQLFYLSRCGVDAFLLNDDISVETAVTALSDFSESYQAACDESQPLFRRRV